MAKYLVIGASGNVGSEIVRLLQQQGAQVRATTGKSDRKIAGAETVQLDLLTGDGLAQAFNGVDGAFLMCPAGYADQFRILSPLIEQAARSRLKKVVLMTARGADAVETSPMRRAELALERSGLPYNIIRPNWFLQNFNSFWVGGIREHGKIGLPAGTAKVSFIDTRDVAAVATRLLTTSDRDNRAFVLTGPEAVDHAQVAAAIAEASGRKVVYEDVEPEVLKQQLLAAGVPADYTDFLIMIFGFLKQGYSASVTEDVPAILGRAPIGLKKYVADYRQAWR